jgi:hypothetical protein
VGVPEREPITAPVGHRDPWLKSGMLDQMGLVFIFEEHIRLSKPLINVASYDGIDCLPDKVPLGIELRGRGFDSRLCVEHKGMRLTPKPTLCR